jgi:putative pyruvate formate lyase activating enzyme
MEATASNLRCVFCQNFETSQQGDGAEVEPRGLARMMLELQARGCHNINLVTPEHVVPQILEALPHAIEGGRLDRRWRASTDRLWARLGL